MRHKRSNTILVIGLLLLCAAPCLAAGSPGRISVYSTPTGALACVDNATCDITGATFTVEGNAWHTVVITLKGYLPWTDQVYVTTDQTSQIDAYLDLDPEATTINVSVHPGGGTVCLDNMDCRANVGAAGRTGQTRYTMVSPGYHMVSVESPAGFEDASRLVKVDLGKTTEASIELSPSGTPVATIGGEPVSTGTVRIYVDRTGSTICLDTTDCYVNVGGSPGPGTGTVVFSDVTNDKAHVVTVTADGYRTVSTPVTVTKDMITTVDISLLPLNGPAISSPVPAASAPGQETTQTPVAPTTRSAPGTVPVIGALALCGALFLARNKE